MAGCAAKHPGVLVLYLSLNQPVTKCGVLFGGRDRLAGTRGGIEAGRDHLERLKYLAPDKPAKRLPDDDFECLPQQDETRIGVLSSAAWSAFERQRKAGLKQFGGSRHGSEEFDIAGQAGVVRQQMTHLDVAGKGCLL